MTVAQIADEIYAELEAPSDLNATLIGLWVKSNIGQLNVLLNLAIAVVDGEFSPPLGEDEKDIYKQLYLVTYYTRKISANLGAAGMDSGVLEVTEGNRTVRVTNRNEIAKTYQTLKGAEKSYLETLISAYKINRALPRQVIDGAEPCGGGMNVRLAGGASAYRDFYDLE